MEDFIIVNIDSCIKRIKQLKHMDKEDINNEFKKYSKQILMVLSIIMILGMIYAMFSANNDDENKINLAEKTLDDESSDIKNIKTKEANNKFSRVVYSVNQQNNDLKNPFTFTHEAESAKIAELNHAKNNKEISINAVTENVNTDDSKKVIDNKSNEKRDKLDVKEYELTAIMDMDNKKMALIKINNKSFRVQEGDTINSVVVNSIGKNNIILQTVDGNLHKYHLRGF